MAIHNDKSINRLRTFATTIAVGLITTSAFADGNGPQGAPEFQVGTGFVSGIARDAAGDFVVAWNGQWARTFNADGTPKGEAFPIAPGSISSAISIAMDGAGDFIVAWQGQTDIFAQRYALNGTAIGGNILVTGSPTDRPGALSDSTQLGPLVAMDGNGDFVVGWTDWRFGCFFDVVGADGSCRSILGTLQTPTYARIYNADGTARTEALKEHSGVTVAPTAAPYLGIGGSALAGLAVAENGNFAMAFTTEGWDVLTAKPFNATGAAAGKHVVFKPWVLVGNGQVGGSGPPSIGIDDSGNFVIAREVNGNMYAARYAAHGTPKGSTLKLDASGTVVGYPSSPRVSVMHSGDFVVTWEQIVGDPAYPGYKKIGQYYHADGTPNGPTFDIETADPNTLTSGLASAVDGNGNLAAAWTTSSGAVMVRLLSAPGP